jgi:hypothetical protein
MVKATGSDHLADEPRALMGPSRSEPSQSFVGAARDSDKVLNFSDDDFDFPPTVHPGRELFTFCLFVLLLIMAPAVWGGWKLISLMLTSLI